MSIYSRVKGAAGERELAKKLTEVFGVRRGGVSSSGLA